MLVLADTNADTQSFAEEAKAFIAANPDIKKIETLYQGYCGPLRGKWLPVSALSKLAKGEVRLPVSTVALDVWGNDIPETGLAIERGDPDGALIPVPGTLKRVPWAHSPTAQVLVYLADLDTGEQSIYNPRAVLHEVQQRFAKKGLVPVMATELEFYFVDAERDENGMPQPPLIPGRKERLSISQIYDLDIMEGFAPILEEINEICAAQGIPADTTIAEFGLGQFEINLLHVANAMTAAENCILFKRVVKAVARKHGMDACFMAKPYKGESGNGFHVHCSVQDLEGNNIFDSGTEEANDTLKSAVAGLVETMQDFQLIFAPHANSYRRLQPASYAPTTPCWGYDHRAAAVRVPETKGKGARLEHRVSGADANPYLVLAAILEGMMQGIEAKMDPGKPVETLEDVAALKPLAANWELAIHNWQHSNYTRNLGSCEFYEAYTTSRISEHAIFAETVTQFECQTYLQKV
ncbi:glutamine synthetase [Rhodobacteraceae bacterium RKSG542]|uniref:glutamine synthetase family protein n=1 Tax=Pseudovibrio flavus TaxID=2529854 RepID=UPI0012BD72DA|nr:glutamine synthetase family protein [Pseudovibrio flavus]MTI18064.1 glutamine synthetase [Pseudovibrio flavus]